MVKSVKSTSVQGRTFEPETLYRVRLARVARRPGVIMRPGDGEIVMKGKLCTELADSIATAVEA